MKWTINKILSVAFLAPILSLIVFGNLAMFGAPNFAIVIMFVVSMFATIGAGIFSIAMIRKNLNGMISALDDAISTGTFEGREELIAQNTNDLLGQLCERATKTIQAAGRIKPEAEKGPAHTAH